jgi:hypothetical protein
MIEAASRSPVVGVHDQRDMFEESLRMVSNSFMERPALSGFPAGSALRLRSFCHISV